MTVDISQFTAAISKLKPIPWRSVGWIVTISFILASIASTIVGYIIMGRTDNQTVDRSSSADEQFNWSSGPTLSKVQLQKILDRNIFNSEGQIGDVDPNASGGSKAAKTSLAVKLVGVIYGGNPFNGIAMIENTEKHSINSFLVGDPLTADATATIKEIHQDQVLIDNQGRLEFALLEEPEVRRSTRKGKKTTKKSDAPASLAGSGFAVDPPPENFKEEGFERKGTAVEMSQDYKSRLLTTDFASVLQDAKASPNVVDGVLKGWRMDRIRSGSIYEKIGVQNNDVIEEINGVMLSDAKQAVATLGALRNEDVIDLRIIRNGKAINFSVKVK